MRMMMEVRIPVEAGNDAIKDGSLMKIMQTSMAELKPEAAYFISREGERCGIMVFDMTDASQIPGIAEPFFLGLEAKVTFQPVMNAADLAAAGPGIAKAVASHG